MNVVNAEEEIQNSGKSNRNRHNDRHRQQGLDRVCAQTFHANRVFLQGEGAHFS